MKFNFMVIVSQFGILIENRFCYNVSSNLFQIFIFKLRPFEVDWKYGFVIVDQSCHDRNDTIEVALLGNGGCALRPEQGRPEDDGDVKGSHLCRLAVLGELVQKL